ncbi:hypothetical protein ACFSTH_15500 [Paenibacillus yanchengensis]|uniref:50S ribosomal protein L33 n=1 Tax=Paenibacillus yanchengensis TaxID=2035833 RepID=A0ABW4YG31_9BACL
MMKNTVTKQRARKLVGKKIYAVQKNGKVVSGKLVKIQGNTLYISPSRSKSSRKGKKVHTKCIIALTLLGIIAIGAIAWGASANFGGGCGKGDCGNQGHYGYNDSYGFW